MRFSSAAIASLLGLQATVAYSQSIASEVAQIPSCALSCLTRAITSAGCGLSDYGCQCGSSKDAITKDATPCVSSSCSASDSIKLLNIVSDICKIQSGGSPSPPATTAAPPASVGSSIGGSSIVSSIGSFVSTKTSGGGSGSASTTASSTTSTAPSQVSGSFANRLQAGGVVAGAVAVMAFVL